MRSYYSAQQKCFSSWAHKCNLSPESAGIPAISQYLLTLISLGLVLSFLLVLLAVISIFHPLVDCHTVFTHLITTRFLKRILRSFLPLVKFSSQWNLNFVQLSVTNPHPSKPLSICSMAHLSMKVAFLVAITLARRVMVDLPHTIFYKEPHCNHTLDSFLKQFPSFI